MTSTPLPPKQDSLEKKDQAKVKEDPTEEEAILENQLQLAVEVNEINILEIVMQSSVARSSFVLRG